MAADRPRRRITQPCLEYNGGLLHKEEIMLRKAMYASLIESKKPSPKKILEHPSSMDHEGCGVNGVLEDVEFISAEEEVNGKHCPIPNDVDNNNSPSANQFEDVQAIEMHSPSSSDAATQKKTKMIKEPSKLLNYVLKKKKEKKNSARTLLRTPSPLKLQAHGDSRSKNFSGREANVLRNTSCLSQNGKVKKKKRQRGALAVFVAMNKSAGGKLNKSHSLGKELLTRAKKKRKRKQKNMETRVCGGGAVVSLSGNGHPGVESEELPTKKYRKEEKKKPHRMVQAQRKFAKRHPLSPNSMRYQVDNNLYATPCTRAKTEDFLTFLCLRSNPVLPKELEVFNNPCLPMSPLSEEEEDVSSPPSPARSQSSMSNSSSAIQISHSDSPVPSVDSPATGEGPSWESGVVRMYADGPKGLAAKGKEEKKFDELLPSDEADSPRDLTKSVTPPLAFRVSSRPTNLSSHRVKDKQLPRPIPKPFAVKPTLTGSSHTKTSASSLAGKVGSCSIPPPPSLVQSSDSSSCSPPPPPLLYIPAAAQRFTHLHGPPTLQRFPSTSPTRDQESTSPSEVKHRLTTIQDDGPPLLKRFPPVDVEQEDAKRNDASKEPYLRKAAGSEFQPISWTSNNREKKDRASVDTVSIERSNSSVCDSTKISEVEKEIGTKATPWKSKEMPLLRRHSSASEVADARVKDHLFFSGASRRINSSSSPPRLQRVPISVDTAVETHLNRVVSSVNLSEPIRKHTEASRSRYSPNFPSHPPRLVRHSPSHLGKNSSPAFLQSDSLTLGVDSSRRQSSPFIDLASSKPVIAQSFQETPFARTIPVVESLVSARHSPLFTSSQSSYKSTYVFSNRQTYVQPENETRPLPISALMMPTANGLNASGNQVEVNAMRLQIDGGFSRLNERQLTPPVQSPCPSPSSTSYIHRGANFSIMPENRQPSNSPVGFKRIPSPRSDLFSGMLSAPVDYSYMSHAGPKIDSAVLGGKPLAFQPSFRQNDNALGGLPPTWSHLQSSYSIPSAASRSSPKPYTFSANLSQASRHSGSYSVLHSNAGTLERYSGGPSGSSDCQYVSVIQHANANKGEPSRREIWTSEQENIKTFQLPKAFQGGDVRSDANSNAFSTIVASPDASRREQSFKDHYKQIQFSVKDSDTVNLNRQTPSVSSNRDTERPPTSDSPRLKAKKDKVSGSTKCVNAGSKVNIPQKNVKKTQGSKQKETVYSLPDKPNDSPVFYPSEEEFRDPVAYINMIRGTGEKFGICVICPPESWKPEFQVSDNLRFNSECQLIHRLQDRWGPVEDELACIRKHLDQQSISLVPMPQIGGFELDLPQFSRVIKQFGGLQKVIDSKKWTKIAEVMKIPRAAQDRIGKLQDIYCKYLLSYDLLPQEEKVKLLQQVHSEKEGNTSCGTFKDSWSVKGRNLSVVPFQRLARNVQEHFFKKPPLANDVEREFWKIVHNRDNYISVHRGSVDTNQENTGFPTEKGNAYSKIGWNLNVLPHLPGSVLKHLGFVQDVTVPWLQFDMIFSVTSWQTHPLALNTVDYLHDGGEKIWYSVPAGERKNFLSVCGQRQSGEKATTEIGKMVSPSSLSDNGVTVTRVVQKEGQFVIVFPDAYYSSISCGYSISEAVAFATPDWVMLGCKRYKELQGTPWWSEFAFEKLLLGLAEELNVENQEVLQCLLTELKSVRDEEKSFMVQLLEVGLVETQVENDRTFSESPGGRKGKKSNTNWPQADSSCVLYCEVCDRPCYVSAVTGEDDPQVLCLKHAVEHIRQRASPEGFKILTRHDTSQLEKLVRKIEEKLKTLQTPQTGK